MTVQQYIIDPACKLLSLIAAGRSMATNEYSDCLDALNELVDTSSAEGQLIYQVTHETFNLTGPATYTMGPTGTFNTVRPEKLRAAVTLASNNASQPCEIVSAEKFSAIPDRSMTGLFAEWICCDYADPISNLFLWPAPVTGGSLELWSLKPLTDFMTIGDTVVLPAGYLAYLKFNLAVAIAGQFAGAKLTEATIASAQQTKMGLAKLHMETIGESGIIGTPTPSRRPQLAPAVPARGPVAQGE
jgi:hypothetical protein